MPVPTIPQSERDRIAAFPQGPEFLRLHGVCAEMEAFYIQSKTVLTFAQEETARLQSLLDGTIGQLSTNPYPAAGQLAVAELAATKVQGSITTAKAQLRDAVEAAEGYQATHSTLIGVELVPTMPD